MPQQLTYPANWPTALGPPLARAVIRSQPEDFVVEEHLGFVPDGEGEHSLLQVEKRLLNTADVVQRLARLAGVSERDVGYSGMKDKHAVTRQWFSVGLAGRQEPDWRALQDDKLKILHCDRHRRKLRRGAHRCNRFWLALRELQGDRDELRQRLEQVRSRGVPNYFGPQRFGRDGNNLRAAFAWLIGSARAPRRQRRSLYLSAVRSYLFNELVADRVQADDWEIPACGDVCLLDGSRSFFTCDARETDIRQRAEAADLHVGLPLWGKGTRAAGESIQVREDSCLAAHAELCLALQREGLKVDYRPARLIADDFCWQFCDDDQLQLSFGLASGGYATSVLRELVVSEDNSNKWGTTSGE